jgi:hypothetical protein
MRVKGVPRSTNAILHPWIREQIAQILPALPALSEPTEQGGPSEAGRRAGWERWQAGLTVKFSLLSSKLPPLRMLLIWDNLTGHWNADLLIWLMQQGVMVLFTPIAGSWLNLCESAQRILVRRALQGQSLDSPEAVMAALESAARGWNACPTPFSWGGKRAERPQPARNPAARYRLGGSGGFTRRPVRRRGRAERISYSCLRGK